MRITFELQDDEEATRRLAKEAQLDRRTKNKEAEVLFLEGLFAREAKRQSSEQVLAPA